MPSLLENVTLARQCSAAVGGAMNHPIHHDADPRIAFVYQEALRGLVQH
jgi:hypothetical protein